MSRKTDEEIRNYIADFESSGKTIDCWCRENKISRSTFYHWRHSGKRYETQRATSNAVHFLEVKPDDGDCLKKHTENLLSLECNDIKISVANNTDLDLLTAVLKVVKKLDV